MRGRVTPPGLCSSQESRIEAPPVSPASTASLSEWLPLEEPATARVRLLCCPHSGSGISPFVPWRRQLPEGVALCPVRYPGRESTMHRSLLRSVGDLVDGVAAALAARPARPTVILGHSLGASVAYELARALQTQAAAPGALASPPVLIASGRQAPEHPHETRLCELPDEALVDAISRRYGGIPAAVRAEPELLAMMLPILRADLTAAETWRPRPGPRWAGPTWIVNGDRDELDDVKLEDWRRSVTGPIDIQRLPGDHFYLFDAKSGFLPALLTKLASL